MLYEIIDEGQPECATPERTGIHVRKKDLGYPIDLIALEMKIAPSVVEDVLKGPLRRPDDPKYPTENISDDPHMAQIESEIPFPSKSPIQCLSSAKYIGDLQYAKPSLIFTHGSGGDLRSEAMANFTSGFVSLTTRPILLSFKGNMNLKARTNMFSTVIEAGANNARAACLGGRSMGARAAILASTEDTTHLVLASYPLQSDKESRDQALIEIPPSTKVLFISGDNDAMCDLGHLEEVRKKMKCNTWLIVVRGTDHGMNVKPKAGTIEVGEMAGALAATWLEYANKGLAEGFISWDPEKSSAQWSGWQKAKPAIGAKAYPETEKPSSEETSSKSSARKTKRNSNNQGHADGFDSAKPKKRQKKSDS